MRRALRLVLLLACASMGWTLPAAATPLTDAIKNADVATVQALIAKGANVNEMEGGIAPLGLSLGAKALNSAAVEGGQAGAKDQAAAFDAVTKLLLDRGANPNALVQNGSYAELAPMYNALGMEPTPLSWSLWAIDPSSAALLIEHGAHVHPNALVLLEFAVLGREGGEHPYTEKFYADLDSRAGTAARLLIEKGAKLVGSASAKGVVRPQVALLGFAQSLCVGTTGLLIEHGADVNGVIEKGPAKAKLLKTLEDDYANENVQRKDAGFSREAWNLINARQVAIMQLLIAHGAKEQ